MQLKASSDSYSSFISRPAAGGARKYVQIAAKFSLLFPARSHVARIVHGNFCSRLPYFSARLLFIGTQNLQERQHSASDTLSRDAKQQCGAESYRLLHGQVEGGEGGSGGMGVGVGGQGPLSK